MCKKEEEASPPLPLGLHLHQKGKKAIKQPLHQRKQHHGPQHAPPPSPSPPFHPARRFHPAIAATNPLFPIHSQEQEQKQEQEQEQEENGDKKENLELEEPEEPNLQFCFFISARCFDSLLVRSSQNFSPSNLSVILLRIK